MPTIPTFISKSLCLFVATTFWVSVGNVTFAAPFAEDHEQLTHLFKQRFTMNYERGKCGPNVLGLVDAAQIQGIDLSNARVLTITNAGNSVMGLVNVERARESGPRIPNAHPNEPRFTEGERNWYHHVVLEYNCFIFDFDFGNTATVIPVSQYLEQMFLDEIKDPAFGFYVGRDEKLKTYRVESIRGSAYFQNKRSPQREGKTPLSDLLSCGQ